MSTTKQIKIVVCNHCNGAFSPILYKRKKCDCGKTAAILDNDGNVGFINPDAIVLNLQDNFLSNAYFKDNTAYCISSVKKNKQQSGEDHLFCQKVLEYLNGKAGTRYEISAAHMTLILQRRNEKFSFDDFTRVIDKKVKEWLNDPERRKYLRPATLFNKTKFHNYIGELDETVNNDGTTVKSNRTSTFERFVRVSQTAKSGTAEG